MVIGLFSFFDGMRDVPLVAGVNAAALEHNAHIVTLAAMDLPYRREASAEAGRGKRWFHERLNAKSVEQVFALDGATFDGFIFAFPEAALAQYAMQLRNQGTPVVLIGREAGSIPRVLNNNAGAVRSAIAQLARRGHRRIAYLGGPSDNLCAARRLQGYLEGIRENGLDEDPALILSGDFMPDTARQQTHLLLERDQTFTAMIAGNDWSAFAALEVLEASGRTVPDDVELVGFDNVSACRWSTPTLSTFDGQLFQLGYVAVEALFQELVGDGTRSEIVIDPIYVPRASTRETKSTSIATRLMSDEWAANRFMAEHQLQQLRHATATESLVSLLESSAVPAEEFAAAARTLLGGLVREKINPICLLPLFHRGASGDVDPGRAQVEALGFAMLADVVLLDTMRAADTAPRFSAATIGLRELPISEASDESALAAVQNAFQRLDFRRAGLLVRRPQPTAPEAGAWIWWSRGEPTTTATSDAPPALELRRLSGDPGGSRWFAVPLIFGEQNLGLLVIDGATEFALQIPDLARLIAATMQSARISTALRESEYFYHSLVESLPQLIVRKDAEGRISYANTAYASLHGRTCEEIVGEFESELYPADVAAALRADDLRIMRTGQTIETETTDEQDGRKRFWHLKKVPLHGAQGQPVGVQVLFWDMTHVRETEAQLRKAQSDLVEASRLAGIAEVATGVLHNVGNTLNSVNTSAGLVRDRIRQLKIGGLARAAQLLSEQGERLPQGIGPDPRRAQLPAYLAQLHGHLEAEQKSALEEIDRMHEYIGRVNQIVDAQNEYSRADPVVESIPPAELIEAALTMAHTAITRLHVAVEREFARVSNVRVQKAKAIQILTHLIRNAVDATSETGAGHRRMKLSLRESRDGFVRISVADNGVGILPENLTRVFQLGFTTKPGGRGFSLHNSALAAREMNGSLAVESAGESRGASFILQLPAEPAAGL